MPWRIHFHLMLLYIKGELLEIRKNRDKGRRTQLSYDLPLIGQISSWAKSSQPYYGHCPVSPRLVFLCKYYV